MKWLLLHLMLTAIAMAAAVLDVTTLFLCVYLLRYRWPRPWLIRLDAVGSGLTRPLLSSVQRVSSHFTPQPLREPAKVLIAVLLLWLARIALDGIWTSIAGH